ANYASLDQRRLAPRASALVGGAQMRQDSGATVNRNSVLFTSIFSAMSIVWDREFGFLKEIRVAPIGRTSVALGKALGGSTVALLQASLLLVLAPLVGVALAPVLVLEVLGLLLLLAFMLSSFE